MAMPRIECSLIPIQYTPASQYSGPVYSQAGGGATPGRSYAPSTTYNPGYQEQGSRRYLSEGELLGEGGQTQGGVGPSTSAGQLQVTYQNHVSVDTQVTLFRS